MSPIRIRLFVVVVAAFTALLAPTRASAELDLTHQQSPNFYMTHVGSIGLLSVASLAVVTNPELVLGAGMREPPGFEAGTTENASRLSSDISDVTLYATVLTPFLTLLAARDGASYQNSLIVYGQAMTTTLLVTSMSKQLALRARPDRFRRVPEAPDDHHSFFSGHSSWSFTAAVSSSLLYSAVEADLTLRSLHFGSALTLASFTAHARVRAGRHYPTDVVVGSLAGAAVGVVVPLLHGIETRIQEEEIAAAGAGLFLGTVIAGLLPDRPLKQVARLSPRLSASGEGMSLALSGSFH